MNRLARAIGHLESVKRMIERDEDCSDVLIQLVVGVVLGGAYHEKPHQPLYRGCY